ncbi:MAG: nuclear transport factor 2 family protein [Pseudomonadota bacterium]
MKDATRLITLAAVSALMASAAATATAPSNKEIVDAMFEAFNAHDVTALKTFYTEDARVFSPEHCGPTIGAQAIAANYAALFEQIPDVHDQVEVVVAEGDRVAVMFTASSELPGAAFRLPIAAMLRFEDGKVVEDRVFYETDTPAQCEGR